MNFKTETINEQVITNIFKKSALITYDSTLFTGLKKLADNYKTQVIPKKQVGEILPWEHPAFSNA